MKLLATRLKPIGPDEAIKNAAVTRTILARENLYEQEIIDFAFLVIGTLLTKVKQYHDKSKYKWPQAREIQVERLEIEMEQNLRKRIDILAECANGLSEK